MRHVDDVTVSLREWCFRHRRCGPERCLVLRRARIRGCVTRGPLKDYPEPGGPDLFTAGSSPPPPPPPPLLLWDRPLGGPTRLVVGDLAGGGRQGGGGRQRPLARACDFLRRGFERGATSVPLRT